jgi:uncharacterized membrane protein YphA (DoxX/SURF4 family)
MFSFFPQLLFLTPLAIAILRVTAGLYLIYIGYFLWSERDVLSKESFPIIGRMPIWLSAIAAIVQTILGILLIVGAWTQLAALLGLIVALKCVLFARTYKKIMPLDRSASVLLLIILLSLVIMGAGAFAFDLHI